MKISARSRTTFGIIGLPRSGTTLLSNIFNSYENSFSLVEPKWVNDHDKSFFTSDKSNIDPDHPPASSVNRLVKIEHQYDIGCIKETYRLHQPEYTDYLLNDGSLDSIIFIFRDPVSNFSSWKRTRWGSCYDEVGYFIECYRGLHEIFLKTENSFLVIYEKLCSGKETYLNSVFRNLTFGEIQSLKATNFRFGDETANSGGPIHPANEDCAILTEQELQQTNESLRSIFNSLNKPYLR